MNFFIHGNKNNKKNNIKIRSSDKKDSTPFVMGGVLYVGGCYFICQYAGWQAAYPHKSFNYLLIQQFAAFRARIAGWPD